MAVPMAPNRGSPARTDSARIPVPRREAGPLGGEVAEWSNVPDSKSGVGLRPPWVRIPPSPPPHSKPGFAQRTAGFFVYAYWVGFEPTVMNMPGSTTRQLQLTGWTMRRRAHRSRAKRGMRPSGRTIPPSPPPHSKPGFAQRTAGFFVFFARFAYSHSSQAFAARYATASTTSACRSSFSEASSRPA